MSEASRVARNQSINRRIRGSKSKAKKPGLLDEMRRTAVDVQAPPSDLRLAGRTMLLLALIYYGYLFVSLDIARPQAATSLLGYLLGMANLVFHEAGHVLLAFLGDFMATLGGSLFQVLFPAVFLFAFLTRHPDPFGASVMLWWMGQNLIDLAPYIADARAQRLILLGGVTGRDVPGYHDWNNILGRLGWLHLDLALARSADAVGSVLIVVAVCWGGYVVLAQVRARSGSTTARAHPAS